jgi:hypothetical protein
MKVYIGPYPDTHWTCDRFFEDMIARRHGKEYGWEVDVEDYDRIDRFLDKLSVFWQRVLNATVNKVVRHRKRKISVRIDPCDTWSMDYTLSLINVPMLKQLRETKHGSPWVDDEDVPHMVKKKSKKKKKGSDGEDDEHEDVHERWAWVLDQMIWSMEQCADLDEGRSHYYVPYGPDEVPEHMSWTDSSTGETTYLLTEKEARELGKYDPELHRAYQERVNLGLRLFGKYYQNLWD